MLENQKAKANLVDIQAELELETAKLMKEAKQKLELSNIYINIYIHGTFSECKYV